MATNFTVGNNCAINLVPTIISDITGRWDVLILVVDGFDCVDAMYYN